MADLTYRSSSYISFIMYYVLYGRRKGWRTIILQFFAISIFSTANMTGGEGQFHVTLLVELCDRIAPLIHNIRNSKHFSSSQYLFNMIGVRIENI